MWERYADLRYRCAKCGEHLEVFQSFSETPLTKHAGFGGKLAKVLSHGVVLKGSGFYKTDNRSSGKGPKKEKTSDRRRFQPLERFELGGSARRRAIRRLGRRGEVGLTEAGPNAECPDPSVWAGMTDEPGTRDRRLGHRRDHVQPDVSAHSFPPLRPNLTANLRALSRRLPPSWFAAEGECRMRRSPHVWMAWILAVLVGFVTVPRGYGRSRSAAPPSPYARAQRARAWSRPRSADRSAHRPRRPSLAGGTAIDGRTRHDPRPRRCIGTGRRGPASPRRRRPRRGISRHPIAAPSTASYRSTGGGAHHREGRLPASGRSDRRRPRVLRSGVARGRSSADVDAPRSSPRAGARAR